MKMGKKSNVSLKISEAVGERVEKVESKFCKQIEDEVLSTKGQTSFEELH